MLDHLTFHSLRFSLDRKAIFLICYLVTVAVYSYFFTQILFTNHTLPNALIYGYPSYKTVSEGRWFADILINLFGSSGIQSLEMILGAGIQAGNGLLFASFLGLRRPVDVLLVTLALCLHPAFLDYYSFSADHVSFTFGDTLAIGGILALTRVKADYVAWLLAIALFVMCLATYQPKMAFIAIMLVLAGLLSTNGVGLRSTGRLILLGATAFVSSMIIYYGTTLLVMTDPAVGERTHLNGMVDMLRQFVQSYPDFIAGFTYRVDFLPPVLTSLPAALLSIGAGAVVVRAYRRSVAQAALALLGLSAIPPALAMSKIVNDQTWDFAGRINYPYAYLLVFAVGVALTINWRGRPVILSCAALLTYFFAVVAVQENNHAAFKSLWDTNVINRLVARIEPLIPNGDATPVAIFGRVERSSGVRFEQYPNRFFNPHIDSDAFADYRQIQILNFFIGRDAVSAATPAQREEAAGLVVGRPIWPEEGSVFLQNGVIVVQLSRE